MEKEFIIPKREVTSIDINEVNKLLEGHSYFELLTEAPTTTYQAQLFDSEGMGTSLMFRIVLRENFTSYIGIQMLDAGKQPKDDEWRAKFFGLLPNKDTIEKEIANEILVLLRKIYKLGAEKKIEKSV